MILIKLSNDVILPDLGGFCGIFMSSNLQYSIVDYARVLI